MVRARLGVGDRVLLLGNVGGRQEIRNTQRGWVTGTHAHFYEEGTVEGYFVQRIKACGG